MDTDRTPVPSLVLPSRVETERLVLRTWHDADRAPFAALNADPDVARYVGGPASAERSNAMVDRIRSHWERHGFGLYAVELRDSGAFAGFVGIHHHPDLPEAPEIGWRLARATWGQGLATEAAATVRDLAFDELGLPAIVSATVAPNVASARVMVKIGMRLVREEPGDPYPAVVYRLDATDRPPRWPRPGDGG